jgi:AhpD family alkylhydroperoxidase
MEARMTNPAELMPDATTGVQYIFKAIYSGGAPANLLELVHMRASQINGCAACVDAGIDSAQKHGETAQRLMLLPVWREVDAFTDAEKAALALTEAMTRLADNPGAVTDEIWDEAADHFSESALASVILMGAVTNLFNRVNTTIRQPAGVRWD